MQNAEEVVECLLQNGQAPSEVRKNKVGLEEYYIELMSKNDVRHSSKEAV